MSARFWTPALSCVGQIGWRHAPLRRLRCVPLFLYPPAGDTASRFARWLPGTEPGGISGGSHRLLPPMATEVLGILGGLSRPDRKGGR